MKAFFLTIFLFNVIIASTFNQNPDPVTINVERNRTLIDIWIGNQWVPDILLDTGFGFDGVMIYNASYQDSFDLTKAKNIKIGGAGSGPAASAYLLDSTNVKVGSINLTGQGLIILEDTIFNGFPSNGIIGYSIFGHYALELDYDKKRMRLHDPQNIQMDSVWTELPIYFKSNKIPWMDISLAVSDEASVPISTYIDFGAGDVIVLLEKPEMKFVLPKNLNKKYIGRGLSGDIHGKECFISKLIIGPYILEHVTASIADAGIRSKQENADAILGCGSLKMFNLIFDYAGKRLFLKPTEAFKTTFH